MLEYGQPYVNGCSLGPSATTNGGSVVSSSQSYETVYQKTKRCPCSSSPGTHASSNFGTTTSGPYSGSTGPTDGPSGRPSHCYAPKPQYQSKSQLLRLHGMQELQPLHSNQEHLLLQPPFDLHPVSLFRARKEEGSTSLVRCLLRGNPRRKDPISNDSLKFSRLTFGPTLGGTTRSLPQ